MGTPSLHCWANRATYSLFAPAPPLIPAPVEELFVLSELTLAFCLWRGSAPFHIKARLCLWSGCESSPPQGLLCMSNTPFQWGSSFSIGQGSWIVHHQTGWAPASEATHSNSKNLGSETVSLLLFPTSSLHITLSPTSTTHSYLASLSLLH